MPPPPAAVAVLRETEEAATLLQPLRLQLVERLATPDTAAGVARAIGLPRQVVNYHLRQLESQGLLELVEERRQGTRTERVLRARAKSYVIAPDALGAIGADPDRVADRFSASYLLAVAARVIRQLGEVVQRAESKRKGVATLTLTTAVRFRTAADRNAFAEELTAAVGNLVGKYHDESASGGRRFEMVVGVYPASNPAPSTTTTREEEAE